MARVQERQTHTDGSESTRFAWQQILLALVAVGIWGANFVAIKVALRTLPPLFLCALRFTLVAFPLVFFLPRPALTWPQLFAYGLTMFGFHFGFLFLGMALGMSAGLASLALQFQVFVTLALAVVFLKEKLTLWQILGAATALAGLGVVAVNSGGDVTLVGLAAVLLAATSWGCANFLSKCLGRVNPLALVAWGSLVVPVPMGIASIIFEGPGAIQTGLSASNGLTLVSVLFIVYLSTHVGYSLWGWLLARHPASSVAPFTLLVPIIGMLTSAWLLSEPLPAWKLQAAALVVGGLVLNFIGSRSRLPKRRA
ncbi:MAG TPA: EamA family transporter [Methylomirabilota bacterium]|nr:EamA family transporter [Methylomirabilota bacterium]